MTGRRWRRRTGRVLARVLGLALAAASVAPNVGVDPASASAPPAPTVPDTPAGAQLTWFLGAVDSAPLSTAVIDAHFDRQFLAAIDPLKIDAALEQLPLSSAPVLVAMVADDPSTSSLAALVDFSGTTLEVTLATDAAGLIQFLKLTAHSTVGTWSQLDSRLAALAPGVGFLAARVTKAGSCVPVHQMAASVPRPTASMFKLFVLGALAGQVAAGRVHWNQELTVEPSLKSTGSIAGSLQYSPAGTRVTVEEAATKMISISDNTAADLLIHLVGRSAVEAQVHRWSSHAALDNPFLTTRELFLLHYADFPDLADRYLALPPAGRLALLSSTVDPLPLDRIAGVPVPRDITSLEWFASPDDLCRSFAGLQSLASQRGLAPVGTVLSVNRGSLALSPAQWRSVWFKGGSEPGVTTLGYRAETVGGQRVVVIAMLEDPTAALPASTTITLLALVEAAFALVR